MSLKQAESPLQMSCTVPVLNRSNTGEMTSSQNGTWAGNERNVGGEDRVGAEIEKARHQ